VPFLSGRVQERNETWLVRQRQLAELSSNGRLIELADSAHYVPFDRPDAVSEAVREVLAELV
jgi:pimeloyl-ACP methyl ester carboxylesterase